MVGCPALMKIALTANNIWKVSKFEEKHTNHELTSPSKTNKHRSHKRRHRDPDVRALMTRLHKEGLRNTNITDAINAVDGNNQEKITGDQVHQHLRVERRNNMGQNCHLLIKHFKERESSEMGFYFAFEVDNDNTFRSVFWADWRSRTSYEKFNDVIIFDVTYRTNDLNLPFAPFTGINHHRQSTLFGCALLADEKEETFVWLFSEWLKCMGGKAPGAIITDQDPAMGNAIARIFPSTRHRFCDWHLDKNIGEHIPQLQAKYGVDFKENLECLRNSKSIPEAEAYWSEFAAKYPMREKSWLPKLWAQRHSWVSCYLRDVFLARCRTSQRAESINSFFDKFVTASTLVNEFVQQYDRALAARREAEEKADFETMKNNPVLTLGWTLEETASKRYTKAIFKIFKEELEDSRRMMNSQIEKDGNITTYIVGRPSKPKSKWRNVVFENSVDFFISCECKQFENEGILCRHALNILWQENIAYLPENYILKRWTIDSRQRSFDYNTVSAEESKSSQVNPLMFFKLQDMCNIVMEESSHSLEEYHHLYSYLEGALERINNRKKQRGADAFKNSTAPGSSSQVRSFLPSIIENSEQHEEINICDPSGPSQHKGRRKGASRIKGGMESSQNEKEKQSRRCSSCNKVGTGHNSRTCPFAKDASKNATKGNCENE